MTPYTHTLSLRLPASMLPIASSIARAMDPDTGGADSFKREILRYEGDQPVYGDTISMATICTAEFHAQAQAMLADPALLFAAVAQDYATRWPDLIAPTLSECEAFVAGVIPDPVVTNPISLPTGETL